ncbi:MAG: hypothetical protein ACR2KK_09095 [Acidimicrobiales bacterium]
MSVDLLAIKFNHLPTSASGDALSIRRNATTAVTVPEWRQGITTQPEDSPAAYAISEVAGNTVTIQARFARGDAKLSSVEVRALDADANPPDRSGCLGFLVYLLWLIMRALAGNVLGEVRARKITFGESGVTGYESFTLKNTRLATAGVGAYTTTWRWQYRVTKRSPWVDMATTNHRVYLVLETPKAPWSQAAGSTALPWTEVLDRACSWARGRATTDDAAAAVTQAVYALGPSVITYDCPGGGSTRYAVGGFDCTAFLERLAGGLGNGQYVNCTDCATIVSTFANVLGCDLWQSRMGDFFGLNPMLGIGSATWEPSCGWHSFSYHEVAWKGACDANERIFDACLQVDGDGDPTAAPHVALLPVNMRFGFPGDGDYRDRLATPSGRPNCNPQPSTRQRRAVV